jgi:hypothetical protein
MYRKQLSLTLQVDFPPAPETQIVELMMMLLPKVCAHTALVITGKLACIKDEFM